MKSVAGCLNSPFDFMGTSLRHKYSDDWDRAISLREKAFRNELYSLFPQREIICVPTQVKVRQGDRVLTDIDAAIFDPQNNVGGLFQLKWQEPFGPSIRARDSRKKNFIGPTTAWIDQVLRFLQTLSSRKLADSFGLTLTDAEQIKHSRLFVVGRIFRISQANKHRMSGLPGACGLSYSVWRRNNMTMRISSMASISG